MFAPTGVYWNIIILNLANEREIGITKAIDFQTHQVNELFSIFSLNEQEHK